MKPTNTRAAFTMIELVFVIVVIGILAAIAVPRLAATRDDAHIAKGRSDVAAIRTAIINERQTRLLQGQTNFIANLGADFGAIMTNPPSLGNGDGQWAGDGVTFTFTAQGAGNTFTYNPANGSFNCTGGAQCAALTN